MSPQRPQNENVCDAAVPAGAPVAPLSPMPPLRRNMAYAVLGNGLFNLCRFGVIVLLAKFTTEEIVGQFDYALAVATPVVLLCSLQLRGALVADAAGQFTFGTYRALRLVGMGAAGVVLLPLIIWKAGSEPSLVFVLILAGVCLGRIVEFVAEIYWGVYQKRERLDLLAWSAVLRGVAMLAPFAVLLPLCDFWTDDQAPPLERLAAATAWAVFLYAAGWLLVFLLFDRRRVAERADVDPSWDWAAVRRLAVQTLPLGLVVLIITLCESVPRYIIERQPDGKTLLGYFGPLAYVALAGTLLISQACIAAGNRVAQHYRSDLPAFLRVGGKLTLLAAGLGGAMAVSAVVFGKWFLRVAYTPEHAAYHGEFVILVVAQGILLIAVVFGALSTYMRLFWIQVPIQIVVLLSTTLAAWLLIPPDPVAGGAWTALVRAVMQVTLYGGCVLIGIMRRKRAD